MRSEKNILKFSEIGKDDFHLVGVDNATKLIKTGDRIRVDGNKGYIEILNARA